MNKIEEQVNKILNTKPRKRFFISDLHFGDERLNLYGRDLMFKNSKEVDEYIIKKWNETISDKDLVIVIGDVSMTKEGLDNLKQCNGEKWLVKGNYDISVNDGGTAKYEINDKILSKYFTKVVNELVIKIDDEKIYLNHFPTNAKPNIFNIVGHIHGTWKVQRNMVNVGVDAWHFVPVSEELIKFQINGIRNHYDQNVYAGELNANLENRKGELKILRAPIYDITNNEDDIIIFLAGPIQGAPEWQEEYIKLLQKEYTDKKLSKNIIIANPKRLEVKNKNFSYDEQVNWESFYLDKASKQGIITFWLAKEKEKVKGRSYAQTSRFEMGEWFGKGQNIDNFEILIGYQEGFEGIKYITKKFKDQYKIDLIDDKDKFLKELIKKINKKLDEK